MTRSLRYSMLGHMVCAAYQGRNGPKSFSIMCGTSIKFLNYKVNEASGFGMHLGAVRVVHPQFLYTDVPMC